MSQLESEDRSVSPAPDPVLIALLAAADWPLSDSDLETVLSPEESLAIGVRMKVGPDHREVVIIASAETYFVQSYDSINRGRLRANGLPGRLRRQGLTYSEFLDVSTDEGLF